MTKFKQTQVGFSLIEAMVAAFVVSFGFLGLAKLQSGFFADTGNSRTQTAALHFAQQKIETLRQFSTATEFDTQLGSSTETDDCNPTEKQSACAGINTILHRKLSLSDCANLLPCKQVVSTVTWTDPDGKAQSMTLTSVIARAEPVESGLF